MIVISLFGEENNEQIVGVALGYYRPIPGDEESNSERGILWDVDGAHDLNNYVIGGEEWRYIGEAKAINDAGLIVGWGIKVEKNNDGSIERSAHGYLLKPLAYDIVVDFDIKPGSSDKCVNINGHGVIPVAILGRADFDVTNIDVDTLALMTKGGWMEI